MPPSSTVAPAPPPEGPALSPALESPLAVHRARKRAAEEELSRLDRKSARLANLRGLAFIGAAVLGGLALFHRGPQGGGYGALGLGLCYAALAAWHGRVFLAEERGRIRVALSERGIARVTGAWRALPETGERFADPEHLYAPDLDVFGHGSLFQLLDQTTTRAGEERLAAWLSGPADAEAVAARQGAVRELSPLIDLREAVALEGRRASREGKADPSGFIRWAEGGPYLDAVRWTRPFGWLLPPLTLALYLLGQAGELPRWSWWLSGLAQLAVVGLTRRAFADFYAHLSSGERAAARLGPAFEQIERQAFTHPLLKRLTAGAREGGEPVSPHLLRFDRLFSFAEVRQSAQLYALLQSLLLWDVHWLFALEGWRRRHGREVRGWFDALAELEALSSLAGFSHDRPDFAFPEVARGEPRFLARGMGHPLLDHPVRNDVSLPGPGSALLITGSNMSGKTTLVRALGANAVLALAGAPVCAEALVLPELRVLTSMRVKDSLERGVSYFYAEVKRLKQVLDAAREARGQALFLLDEILLGTNTRERQIASREVLELLLGTGAIGAVTTHDLSLAALEGEPGARVHNVHFRDLLVDGKMSFDYRLRQGVVDTTNALRVLEQAGIPIRGRTW